MPVALRRYAPDFFQLCYRGTDEGIRLGDHITYRHFIGLRRRAGRVFYVPGVSPPHSEMGYGPRAAFWAIKLEDEVIVSWLYVPHESGTLASWRLRFVKRSSDPYVGLEPEEKVGIGLPYEEEPNKAPEPTTMAVTPRAPSSTSRASHGRGSS